MNPLFHTDFSISDSLKSVRKSVLIYETIIVSATPKRGDSLDRIIYMLLGPLRHRFTALERAQEQGIGHYFVPRYTRVVDNAEKK